MVQPNIRFRHIPGAASPVYLRVPGPEPGSWVDHGMTPIEIDQLLDDLRLALHEAAQEDALKRGA